MKTRILIGIAGTLTLSLALAATLLEPERARSTIPPPTPRAFSQARPPSEAPTRVAQVARDEGVLHLDELRIVGGRRPVPRPSAIARQKPKLVPCSDWRALGPVYSAPAGTIPRQRHVQLLCPESKMHP